MIDARQHVIGKLIPFDFETITVAATAIGFTALKLAADPKIKQAILTLETASIRYRIDGTNPTSSVGHLMQAKSSLVLEGFSQLNNFKAIRTGGTSGSFSVTFLR